LPGRDNRAMHNDYVLSHIFVDRHKRIAAELQDSIRMQQWGQAVSKRRNKNNSISVFFV
jgi:hypothetical protein